MYHVCVDEGHVAHLFFDERHVVHLRVDEGHVALLFVDEGYIAHLSVLASDMLFICACWRVTCRSSVRVNE